MDTRSLITIAGLTLVTAGLTFIALDLIDLYIIDLRWVQQPEPPYFLMDFVPERIEVCDDFYLPSDWIQSANWVWDDLGWPKWPEEVNQVLFCDDEAFDGVVRFHNCEGVLVFDDVVVEPCGDKRGAAYVHLNDGRIMSADIYVAFDAPPQTLVHEIGHARGLIRKDGKSAHSTDNDNLMYETAGSSLKWLDRRPGGDWPY